MIKGFFLKYAVELGLASASLFIVLWFEFLLRRLEPHTKLGKKIILHIVQSIFFIIFVLSCNYYASTLISDYHLKSTLDKAVDVVTLIAIGLIVLRQVFFLINLLQNFQINKGTDPTSARILARVIKIAITVILVLLFGNHYGLSLSGLLAFGGIGGIAIGLAGKDILSNFFSGVLLFYDRQFNIGDWISSPDRQIEGTVVEIGWRLTKIMTFDHRPLYVPNSLFSSISVENPGRMTNRRIDTNIALRYEDAGKVSAIVADIRTMLVNNPDIDQNQTILVYFNEFADSSLNILVYCFTKTTKWARWLEAQQNVYLKIIDIVHQNGADFAFNTQTLYLENTTDSGSFNAPTRPTLPK